MNIFILTFTLDLASMNVFDKLKPYFVKTDLVFDSNSVYKLDLTKLVSFNLPKDNSLALNDIYLLTSPKESVFYENLDEFILSQTKISPNLIVFATKHQSASGINSLSCHAPGNWGTAQYGGKDLEVCISPAKLLNDFFLKLNELNTTNNLLYDVILECTHHGPFIKTPCAFIEIGSNEIGWKNQIAGHILTNTLLSILPYFSFNTSKKVALGIGGPHHSPEFSKRLIRDEFLISHVCPKYMLNQLTTKTLQLALTKSIPKTETILLDWKGLGEYKQQITSMLDEILKNNSNLNLQIIKTKDLSSTN